MRLINPSVELIRQDNSFDGMLKHIELCGRTAYKSEDKITEDSASGFVDRIVKSNHGAVLEHGTVYLTIPLGTPLDDPQYMWKQAMVRFFEQNKFSKVNSEKINEPVDIEIKGYGMRRNASATFYYITTNWRVIIENVKNELVKHMGQWKIDGDRLKDYVQKWMTDPTDKHEKRITLKVTCSRGISHEIVRHRSFSFIQESQRYCNYSKNKFNNEVSFIKPSWCDIPEGIYTVEEDDDWTWIVGDSYRKDIKSDENDVVLLRSLLSAEQNYMLLTTNNNVQPQNARDVLPNAVKTEICITGFESDWKHFFDLRYFEKTGKAHPDMKIIAEQAYKLVFE